MPSAWRDLAGCQSYDHNDSYILLIAAAADVHVRRKRQQGEGLWVELVREEQ